MRAAFARASLVDRRLVTPPMEQVVSGRVTRSSLRLWRELAKTPFAAPRDHARVIVRPTALGVESVWACRWVRARLAGRKRRRRARARAGRGRQCGAAASAVRSGYGLDAVTAAGCVGGDGRRDKGECETGHEPLLVYPPMGVVIELLFCEWANRNRP